MFDIFELIINLNYLLFLIPIGERSVLSFHFLFLSSFPVQSGPYLVLGTFVNYCSNQFLNNVIGKLAGLSSKTNGFLLKHEQNDPCAGSNSRLSIVSLYCIKLTNISPYSKCMLISMCVMRLYGYRTHLQFSFFFQMLHVFMSS